MSVTNGKVTDGQNEFFFLVYLLKIESDTATSKNIAIIIKYNRFFLDFFFEKIDRNGMVSV